MGMGSHKLNVKIWLVFTCVFLAPNLYAQLGLPDSARPGAVRPEEVLEEPTIPQSQPLPNLELDIPAVIDRPFDVDEGDRVVVQQFRLLNARDMPRLDISVAEIQQILDSLRDEKPEGYTIGQLEDVSETVSSYYRERGLILAQAVIPVQTVESGVVEIRVYEGTLDRVLTEGNEVFSSKVLERPFKHLIGKPVTKAEIESALLSLTDYSGLSVFGVFQPGRQVGTSDIVLRVQDEKRYDVSYRIDNHGLRTTGRGRFRPVIEWNNPTGGADKISATIQQTYRPKNNIFYAMDYERHMGYGLLFTSNWNRNEFDVGGELKD